ncbi:sensor domain-containing diguanylate cyclase [Thiohalophilus thiocyanatoxydans]|uniref:diguanylate cyclase n=1 Tax=Thiohalophilus thiocyanatoxydans TaxID=381308 RepID=A0A4R8IUV2_9GAMM|nr:diguanylate cyclase [Thiohalophilus thiocyanatoxydans]TDY04204.1 PAS domain S-box-containing protein/diguanylate cyclase (GGDEF)-like protein [Thiohalophilus thiocyanatoxydans]
MNGKVAKGNSMEERFSRQQQALLQVSRLWCELGSGADPVDAMRIVTQTAVESLMVGRASVWTLHETDPQLLACRCHSASGSPLKSMPETLAATAFPAYTDALDRNETVIWEAEPALQGPLGQLMVVPISCLSQRIGVLCLEGFETHRQYFPDELSTAHHLANILAAMLAAQQRRKEAEEVEEQLRDEVTLWNNLLDQSWDGIVILEVDGGVFLANQRYADILGYSKEELQGLHVWDWDVNYDREQLLAMLADVDEMGAHFETRQRRKDGAMIDIELSNNGCQYKGRKLILCICRDITERKRTEKHIHRLATMDSLTGLANRREFTRVASLEVQRSKRHGNPLSLIMYDLDHFKRINDSFGHSVGDDILRAVSEIARVTVRKTDLVGRWGGEEFMVLLPQTPLEDAALLAERFQKALDDHDFPSVGHVTASFGVTGLRPEDALDSLVLRVDKALYRAKKNGRNRVEPLE